MSKGLVRLTSRAFDLQRAGSRRGTSGLTGRGRLRCRGELLCRGNGAQRPCSGVGRPGVTWRVRRAQPGGGRHFVLNARETVDALCVRLLNILGRRPWPSCGGRSAGWHETKQEDPWGCRRPRRRWWWQRPWRPKAPAASGRRAGRAVDLLRVRRGLGGTERVRVASRSPHPILPFLLRPVECRVCLLTGTASSLHPHSDSAGFRSCLASRVCGTCRTRSVQVDFRSGLGSHRLFLPIPVFVIEILGLQEHQESSHGGYPLPGSLAGTWMCL